MMACPLVARFPSSGRKSSGPAPVTFSNPAGGSTLASFSVAGIYVLRLAVSDSQLTGSGTVSILVNPAGTNQPPLVSITADNSAITLPTNSVTLTGVITDDGLPGGPITTQWSQVSGPGTASITQLTSTSVKVTFPVAGVYVIKLTASDGQLSSSATISITVTTAGGNQPPSVSAGPSQTIQLPTEHSGSPRRCKGRRPSRRKHVVCYLECAQWTGSGHIQQSKLAGNAGDVRRRRRVCLTVARQ